MTRCRTLTLTNRCRGEEWPPQACALRKGPFRKAGTGGPGTWWWPPSRASLAPTMGTSGRGALGLHTTWALQHRHPCPAHPINHCPEKTPSLIPSQKVWGHSTRNRGASFKEHAEPTGRACVLSFMQPRRFTSSYYVPGPAPGSGNSAVNKTHPYPLRARSPGGSKPSMR